MIDVLVIGAGWSGLTAAARLASAGYSVSVVEKSRGPGGRSATRREDGFAFDHGAQYLTARSEAFLHQVQAWSAAGLLAPWTPELTVFGPRPRGLGGSPGQRWVGVGGMNAVLHRLSQGLDCRWQWRADTLRYAGGRWTVSPESGEPIESRAVLVTAPPRQSSELLGQGDALAAELDRVEMTPCWALMLGFEQALELPFDAAFVNEGPLSWIARNDTRPGRESGPAWLGHASARWSAENLESDPADVSLALKNAMAELAPEFGAEASLCKAHRWRYAMCRKPLKGPILADNERKLVVGGDWCAGDRVEGAWISGMAAARRLDSIL